MRCHFPVLQAGPGSAVLLVLECVSVTGEEGATWSRGPLSLHEESGTKIGGCTLQWGVVDSYFCRESCLDGIRVLTEGGQLSSLAKDTHIHMLPSVGTQSCSKDVHSHFIGSLIKKQVFLTSGR